MVSEPLFVSVVVVTEVVVVVGAGVVVVVVGAGVVVVVVGAGVVVVVVVVSSSPIKLLKKEEFCSDSSCMLISSTSANSSMKASSAPRRL